MTIYGGLFLVVFLFFFSLYGDYIPQKKRIPWLLLMFFIVVFMIGNRSPYAWIDTIAYGQSFMTTTKTLLTFSFSDRPYAYTEKGYYLLCVIAKTISNSYFFYFTFIGALSMFFIFIGLKKYCLFPFLGFFIYAGRFLVGRDFNQMRAGLAIAFIIYATCFLHKRKMWQYLLCSFVAYTIHTSALIVIPFYFINYYKFKRIHIIWGLIIAFIIAGFFGNTIKAVISNLDFVQNLARSYVEEGSVKAWENNLANPMIYFQCAVLLVFTFKEKILSKSSVYYYTIRNVYFYSTLFLIVLCRYGVVSARTSTVFATYEMIMIPMIICSYKKNERFLPYLITFLLMIVFFIKNWPGTNFGL